MRGALIDASSCSSYALTTCHALFHNRTHSTYRRPGLGRGQLVLGAVGTRPTAPASLLVVQHSPISGWSSPPNQEQSMYVVQLCSKMEHQLRICSTS